jgi:hypothetical protein
MCIINPKSIIHMDPTRPGQLGRPGPRANLGNVTRCKMFGRPNSFRQSQPPGEATQGLGLHNEAGEVPETGTSPAVLPLPSSVSPGPPRSLPTPFHRKPDHLAASSLASLAALGGSYLGRHPCFPPGQQSRLGWGAAMLHCSPPKLLTGPL